MQMKLKKSSQLGLVSAAGLLAALMVTACAQFTQTLTVDFVYVASSKAFGANQYGLIDVFEINSESGRMRQIPSSPFPSGGRNPVAEAVSADNESLFVANHDDNNIVQFVIGTDGKLYPFNTVNTPGIFPLALAANQSDLFVLDTYQPLPICSTAQPCSGSIAVYPLTGSTPNCAAKTCLGAPAVDSGVNGNYWPLTLSGANASDVIVPTGVNALASGDYVYVTAYDSSVSPSVGYIYGFSVAPASSSAAATGGTCPASGPISAGALPPGTLCALNGGAPIVAGIRPTGVASDPTSSYLYVTDYESHDVLGYAVSAATGALTPMTSGGGGTNVFAAGNGPSAMVIDPAYSYAYVADSLDATVTAYSISNGALSQVGTYTTGTQPVAIGIDPSTEHFLYTANFLGDTVSGFQLSPTAGTLLISQYSPYAASPQPTAVAAIPHKGTGAGVSPP